MNTAITTSDEEAIQDKEEYERLEATNRTRLCDYRFKNGRKFRAPVHRSSPYMWATYKLLWGRISPLKRNCLIKYEGIDYIQPYTPPAYHNRGCDNHDAVFLIKDSM